MPTINQLSTASTLALTDLIAIYSSSNGDARKTSFNTILAFIQANLTFPTSGVFTTQYAAPSATLFSVSITDGSANIHLILTPTAGFADGTIVLPAVANAVDKQEILVNCTQVVTALVINGNGATAVTGAPTLLAANDFLRLKYDAPTSTWYRVG